MRIVVCDDELLARDRLKRLLAELGHEVVAEAENGLQAIESVQATHPDVVMLDIRMPELDGIQCAARLSEMDVSTAIIFVTAFDQHAIAAFQTNAVGYLLKPISQTDLELALNKTMRLNQAQLLNLQRRTQRPDGGKAREHIVARSHRGIELISVDHVYYFLADQKYITVRHRHGQVLIDETLKNLEHEFEDQFIRIHRNALLAVNCIDGLEMVSAGQYQVRCRGIDERLAVSRRHLPSLRDFAHSQQIPID